MWALMTWLPFLFRLYLSWRQRQVYLHTATPPPELSDVLDLEVFSRSRAYCLEKLHFSIVKSIVEMTLSVFMKYAGHQFFWTLSEMFSSALGSAGNGLLSGAAFTFFTRSSIGVVMFPFDLYFHFVLEEKYGFNKLTFSYFLQDTVKYFFAVMTSLAVFSSVATFIINRGGDYFHLQLWLLFAISFLVFIFSLADIIIPLFYSFTLLPLGLEAPVKALFGRVGFPFSRLRVVKAFERSTHSNAFMTGLFQSKMIVLYDTLLRDFHEDGSGRGCDKDEVLGVLGHELGHWKLKHMEIKISTILAVSLVLAIVFKSDLKENLILKQPAFLNLYTLVVNVVHPFVSVVTFGVNWWSRRNEYEADEFAASLGLAPNLRRALIKMTQDNLSFPVDDWLYASYFYTHPTLLQRLDALRKYD